MIDNSVYGLGGRLIGFRCLECGDIVSSMWGDTCNRCRNEERRHRELVEALKQGKGKEKNDA